MKAPFPWFGGKRRVASHVWEALGDVDNYVEPFAGSLAVLLERPARYGGWQHGAETVNDADAYLANLWRALSADPDGVCAACDWPVNETDLFARHLWLVNEGRERIARLEADPTYYDIQVAGWWLWGVAAWIGSGWCSGAGPWQLPHLGDAGRGVNRQLPHLGDAGQGVNRQLSHLGNGHAYSERKAPDNLRDYLHALATRLRRVRVCCGDWSRVVTRGALAYGATVGVLLDPPYLGDVRAADLYTVDDARISTEVRQWAIEHGDDPRLRIVLCGYEAEHAQQIPESWRMHRYSASKAYGSSGAVGSGEGNDVNRHNERLWFSPHCLQPRQGSLFAFGGAA